MLKLTQGNRILFYVQEQQQQKKWQRTPSWFLKSIILGPKYISSHRVSIPAVSRSYVTVARLQQTGLHGNTLAGLRSLGQYDLIDWLNSPAGRQGDPVRSKALHGIVQSTHCLDCSRVAPPISWQNITPSTLNQWPFILFDECIFGGRTIYVGCVDIHDCSITKYMKTDSIWTRNHGDTSLVTSVCPRITHRERKGVLGE